MTPPRGRVPPAGSLPCPGPGESAGSAPGVAAGFDSAPVLGAAGSGAYEGDGLAPHALEAARRLRMERVIRTARLVLAPVGPDDLGVVQALKTDERVFAVMLGGVRTPARAAAEMAEDVALWEACGYGMFAVREEGAFIGIAGLHERPDGRGPGLRFALWPEVHGRGLAAEAAGAVLRFAHRRAGLARVVAVAREVNFASRSVLGRIGMRECETFWRDPYRMIAYESVVEEASKAGLSLHGPFHRSKRIGGTLGPLRPDPPKA